MKPLKLILLSLMLLTGVVCWGQKLQYKRVVKKPAPRLDTTFRVNQRPITFLPKGLEFVKESWYILRIINRTTNFWVIKLNNTQLLYRYVNTSKYVNATFSPDGSKVLTASEDGTAKVWEIPKAKQ